MKALVTGASSGIGKDIAIYLANKGIDLVLVAREEDKLKEVAKNLQTKVETITMDLSIKENCLELYKKVQNIDILINNAGFGTFGSFTDTDINLELNMINTNVCAMHILTKLYLKDMKKRNDGYILNVASIAGFMPGPLMATYYASKAYVFRLTQSIKDELRKEKSNVSVSCLCPGPTKTKFLEKANVKFKVKNMDSNYVAKYAIDNMFKKKFLIIPGFTNKCIRVLSKIIPDKIIGNIIYKSQEKRK